MKNNLCTSCSGRGFHWKAGAIVSRKDGSEIATTYQQGPKCEECNGYGYDESATRLLCWIAFVIALVTIILPAIFGGK